MLWRFVIGRARSIHDPDQERRDRHPGELIPIEEREAEQRWVLEIVERHPQQADERQQQQHPHGGHPLISGSSALVSRPAIFWLSTTGSLLRPAFCFAALQRCDALTQ